MLLLRLTTLAFVSAAVACGGTPEPAPKNGSSKAKRSAKAPAKAKDEAAPDPIKGRCPGKRSKCLPPGEWVAKLCEDVYPDVALHMFRPKTQWLRLYMLHTAEPFNASGGASLMGEKMRRGEEVIALRRRSARADYQMADLSGYDVIRWNGACATVHDGEFTSVPPDDPGHAKVEWREIGLPLRLQMEKHPDIQETYEARRKACKAIRLGRVSAECEEYDKKFTAEIVRYVRNGGKLPPPAKAP